MDIRTIFICFILTFLSSTLHAQSIECALVDAGSNVNEMWTPSQSGSPLSDSRTIQVQCRDTSGSNSSIYVCFNVDTTGMDTQESRTLNGQTNPANALTYTLTGNSVVLGNTGTLSSTAYQLLSLTSTWTPLSFVYNFNLNNGQDDTIVPDTYTGGWTFVIQYSLSEGCASGAVNTVTGVPMIQASVQALSSCDLTTQPLTFIPTTSAGTRATVNANTSLQIWCTLGTTYVVSMDKGLNETGGLRYLKNEAGTTINYEIYRDSAYANIWGAGDLSNLGQGLAGTGSGTTASIPTYGQAFLTSETPGGTYTDTIVVTLNY